MIFGFNTDVKHGDTIYHVQSEARESEKLLQTQVFMRGRCIGKKAISYAPSAQEGTFGDTQKEQQLRDQHRLVLEAIREGKLDDVLDHAEIETLAAIKQLDVEWENASSVHANGNLTMRLRVTEAGTAVPAARLTFRFARPDATPFYTQAVSDSTGAAEISFQVDESALPDASIMVQANHEGRTVTRKFALKKTE
ncbi:MAG TPA: hypothetical protein VGZ91_13195 [Candidatus Sulfotelmatobacter sp.]|jgi:hypothetical protein|nr:hypothetical protein [Candidatus Sulfotelmatobacter sp.]